MTPLLPWIPEMAGHPARSLAALKIVEPPVLRKVVRIPDILPGADSTLATVMDGSRFQAGIPPSRNCIATFHLGGRAHEGLYGHYLRGSWSSHYSVVAQ